MKRIKSLFFKTVFFNLFFIFHTLAAMEPSVKSSDEIVAKIDAPEKKPTVYTLLNLPVSLGVDTLGIKLEHVGSTKVEIQKETLIVIAVLGGVAITGGLIFGLTGGKLPPINFNFNWDSKR